MCPTRARCACCGRWRRWAPRSRSSRWRSRRASRSPNISRSTRRARCPPLIDGERAIYKSLAICEYLAARHGSDLLVAPDEPERPEFLQWLWYGEATLQAPMSAMARVGRIRNKTPEMQAGIDAVMADVRHSLSMRLKLLEQRLDGRDFLVAGRMTLADISVGYPLIGIGMGGFARCSARAPPPIASACSRGRRSSARSPCLRVGRAGCAATARAAASMSCARGRAPWRGRAGSERPTDASVCEIVPWAFEHRHRDDGDAGDVVAAVDAVALAAHRLDFLAPGLVARRVVPAQRAEALLDLLRRMAR